MLPAWPGCGVNPLVPVPRGGSLSPSLRFPSPGAAAPRGYQGRGSQILAGSLGTPCCRQPPFSSNLISGRRRAQTSIPIPILRYSGQGTAVVWEGRWVPAVLARASMSTLPKRAGKLLLHSLIFPMTDLGH